MKIVLPVAGDGKISSRHGKAQEPEALRRKKGNPPRGVFVLVFFSLLPFSFVILPCFFLLPTASYDGRLRLRGFVPDLRQHLLHERPSFFEGGERGGLASDNVFDAPLHALGGECRPGRR